MLLLFLVLFTLFALILLNIENQRRQLPNGPRPFPLLGNFPHLLWSQKWEAKFAEWRQKFGPLYTFWYGPLPAVIVADHEVAVELLVKNSDACSSRGVNKHFNEMCRGGTYGLVLTSGDLWAEQRKFALKVLREFGMGSNQMQEKVLNEVHKVSDSLQKYAKNGQKVDPVVFTDLGVGSVIHAVLFGYSFDESNRSEFDYLKDLAVQLTRIGSEPLVAAGIMSETVAKLPIFKSRMQRFVDMWHDLRKFVDGVVEKRLKDVENGVCDMEKTDFVNAFLIEMRDQELSGKKHYFSLDQLNSVAIDLWVAGQETTASTISWILAILVKRPEIQERLFAELQEKIGKDQGEIRMCDRTKLTYMNAFILEAQRYSNVIVQNVLRLLTRDVEIQGQLLKKGTFICPQISAMLRDPKHFPSPDEFQPERFIDPKNGQLRDAEKMVAFSLGKRACPGENLAKMELFLFTANLVNKFKFTQTENSPIIERQTGGISTAVRQFECYIEERY